MRGLLRDGLIELNVSTNQAVMQVLFYLYMAMKRNKHKGLPFCDRIQALSYII